MSEEKLDEKALKKAIEVWWSGSGGVKENIGSAILAYLTASRPVQGFEPDWKYNDEEVADLQVQYFTRDSDGLHADRMVRLVRVDRPAPAKLTDEEIDEEALEFALKGTSQRLEAMKAIENFVAKREELKEKYK